LEKNKLRTLCEVIKEARKTYETRNFSYLLGLLEEIQVLGNRMEAGLGEKHDVEYYRLQRKALQVEVEKLREEKALLQAELGKNSDDTD
jgi:hypothetical protein